MKMIISVYTVTTGVFLAAWMLSYHGLNLLPSSYNRRDAKQAPVVPNEEVVSFFCPIVLTTCLVSYKLHSFDTRREGCGPSIELRRASHLGDDSTKEGPTDEKPTDEKPSKEKPSEEEPSEEEPSEEKPDSNAYCHSYPGSGPCSYCG